MKEDSTHLSGNSIKLLADILVDRSSTISLPTPPFSKMAMKMGFLSNKLLIVRLVNLPAFLCKPHMS